MNISSVGIALVERFEGCKLDAYRDQRGIWSIGYGHTGHEVYPAMRITQTFADQLLHLDLATAEAGVNHLVKVPLSQNQFDALVDFGYNVGLGALAGSTLLRELNSLNYQTAAREFCVWDKTHINGALTTDPGLFQRRTAEAVLFINPT